MTDEKTVPEEMLHAYVDGELSPEEAVRVDAWLASHPEDAATVAAWRHQNALIREAFGQTDDVSAVPGAKRESGQAARRRLAFAASLAAFVIGVGAGIGIGIFAPGLRPAMPSIAAQAETAYRVYSVEKRHPVEVGADEREHLVKWLSNRLDTPLALPDLSGEGLVLVGGRLTTSDSGPAALFMFEGGNGERYTVYVTRAAKQDETAFRFDLGKDVGGCYWRDRGIEVVVNGPADRQRLQAVANQVYDAYEETSDTVRLSGS